MKSFAVLCNRLSLLLAGMVFGAILVAQPNPDPMLDAFRWRNIGPANQGGRIVDIEAAEKAFTHVFLATGSGGVWKSVNAGNSWEPIFDQYATASIGDIALFQPNPDIIWVGTGEANNRNSVSWGAGVFKSMDGGKSFQPMGLDKTQQIARIVTHPTDPNTVYVGAIGALWGHTGDRGLFKSADGGKTWIKLGKGLPDDGRTGCTDLVMDPSNPNVLYAAFYERIRYPWVFYSGGNAGGIFKTTDGGKTWAKLTQGLPPGPTGRIGLAVYRKNPKIVMALVEAKQSRSLDSLGSGVYRSEDAGKTWRYVNTYNNRPFYYSQIRINPQNDQRVYLLTTPFMVSEDGGKSFRNGSEDEEVHGDFHAMWLDPADGDRYYLGADKGASLTHDHGNHFFLFDNLAIGQFYRIGADMRDPYYVYGGLQDNGFYATASFTRDARGILNDANWKVHWGDGQYAIADPTDWRTVYTSMENGSIFRYDPLTRELIRITPMPTTISNYPEAVPAAERRNGDPFRYNWSAPLVMSPHDPKTLFMGSNYLFKSTDQGRTWQIISPDLSTNHPVKRQRGFSGGVTPDNTGAESHCTIFTIAPSPANPQTIWAGTDDGNVQLTQDGGATWTNVRRNVQGVPDSIWVSRIEASHFDAATAYVSFDGHRSNVFAPFLFKTKDNGKTWINIGKSLPAEEVIRVVKEDLRNPNLLFIGTETGVWFSLNAGESWARCMPGMPTVSVYDLFVHPRDGDLIAGTHGRSLWIMDDIGPLQQMTPRVMQSKAWLFEQRQATLWNNTSRGGQRGHFWFAGENPPSIRNRGELPRAAFDNSAMIHYYVGESGTDSLKLEISDPTGKYSRTVRLDPQKGIHRYLWDFQFDAVPYTSDQKQAIEAMFADLLARYPMNALRQAYTNYQRASTPLAQRRIIENLRTGVMSLPIPTEWGLPSASEGTYFLKLTWGSQEWKQTLRVRKDPEGGR
ncbi:MAG: hypothetical protein KIPDCIKN_00990 [Haliscomenobacter sp.]|nr:hypothetical protein [Haliscomenobacter sp.]